MHYIASWYQENTTQCTLQAMLTASASEAIVLFAASASCRVKTILSTSRSEHACSNQMQVAQRQGLG